MKNINKKTVLIAFMLLIVNTLNAFGVDMYQTQPASSTVKFKVTNFGISFVQGKFEKFSGALAFDGNNLARFEGMVDMASLNTGISFRDDDLRSDSFFAVKKFPVMTIKSNQVLQSGDTITIHSNLTIRGTTKPVELHGKVNRFDATKIADLSLEGTINRKDFGLRLNKIFEFFVGDDVIISLKLQAKNDLKKI